MCPYQLLCASSFRDWFLLFPVIVHSEALYTIPPLTEEEERMETHTDVLKFYQERVKQWIQMNSEDCELFDLEEEV